MCTKKNNRYRRIKQQSGVIFLLFIMTLILAGTLVVVGQLSRNKQSIQSNQATIISMASAKDALMGYALGQTIPGMLPCPDRDGDGDADTTGVSCSVTLGFLPFRDLGLPELRDTSGTKLWYSIDPTYALATPPFNSSSESLLTHDGNNVAFVILAPNASLHNQTRNDNNPDIDDYFEGDNADNAPYDFIYQYDDDHNDQLLSYSLNEFWALIESSIVAPAATLELSEYLIHCGSYPWAVTFNNNTGTSTIGLQQGLLPLVNAIPSDGSSCASSLSTQAWLRDHWSQQLYYQFCLPSQGQCLNIAGDSMSTASATVIAPGTRLSAAQIRPSNNLADYFENTNATIDNNVENRSIKNHDVSFNDVLRSIP